MGKAQDALDTSAKIVHKGVIISFMYIYESLMV